MRDRYVVDTNVLIAASAADPIHPKDIDATPADPLLRMRVWQWLDTFQSSPSRMVLDLAGGIFDEYNKKLGFNDFGIQVVMHKWSTAAVDNVDVAYDEYGHGILQLPLLADAHTEISGFTQMLLSLVICSHSSDNILPHLLSANIAFPLHSSSSCFQVTFNNDMVD